MIPRPHRPTTNKPPTYLLFTLASTEWGTPSNGGQSFIRLSFSSFPPGTRPIESKLRGGHSFFFTTVPFWAFSGLGHLRPPSARWTSVRYVTLFPSSPFRGCQRRRGWGLRLTPQGSMRMMIVVHHTACAARDIAGRVSLVLWFPVVIFPNLLFGRRRRVGRREALCQLVNNGQTDDGLFLARHDPITTTITRMSSFTNSVQCSRPASNRRIGHGEDKKLAQKECREC
jgi:hypothetical protein